MTQYWFYRPKIVRACGELSSTLKGNDDIMKKEKCMYFDGGFSDS